MTTLKPPPGDKWQSAAGRLGDHSHCAGGSGDAVTGSANVLINNRAALRVDDTGLHAGCDYWIAKTGAPRVLVNNRAAHRIQDLDSHGGRRGTLVTGSATVLIGNQCISGQERPIRAEVAFVVLDAANNPLTSVTVEVRTPRNETLSPRTDQDGRVRLHNVEPGDYVLHLKGHWLSRITVKPI